MNFTPDIGEAVRSPDRARPDIERLSRLTPRERQVIRLVSYGETSKTIGRKLGISFRTVEVHRAHIMAKLGIRSLAEIVLLAIREWPELERDLPEPSRGSADEQEMTMSG